MAILDKKRALEKLEKLFGSPELFPQQLDLTAERVLLLRLDERTYHEAAFLDERLSSADIPGFWVGLDDLEARFRRQPAQPPPQHWIFHVGHCGSTLLSRLLGALGGYLPLREPPVLRSLAAAQRDLATPLSLIDPARWPLVFDLVLALLGRRYRVDGLPLVKATSSCNNLLSPVLDTAPDSRALALYLSLENYLATMLRAGGSRTDTETHARSRLQDLLALSGPESDLRLYQLSLPQRAVVNWLSCVALFSTARASHAERLLLLDFDDFLRSPESELLALARFFGSSTDPEEIANALGSGVMNRYAKAPEHAYSAELRARELNDSRQRFSAEIRHGLGWAETMLSAHPALEQKLNPVFLPGAG